MEHGRSETVGIEIGGLDSLKTTVLNLKSAPKDFSSTRCSLKEVQVGQVDHQPVQVRLRCRRRWRPTRSRRRCSMDSTSSLFPEIKQQS